MTRDENIASLSDQFASTVIETTNIMEDARRSGDGAPWRAAWKLLPEEGRQDVLRMIYMCIDDAASLLGLFFSVYRFGYTMGTVVRDAKDVS